MMQPLRRRAAATANAVYAGNHPAGTLAIVALYRKKIQASIVTGETIRSCNNDISKEKTSFLLVLGKPKTVNEINLGKSE